eukprot:6173731-Pleurochrysis_carterae.AAC.1
MLPGHGFGARPGRTSFPAKSRRESAASDRGRYTSLLMMVFGAVLGTITVAAESLYPVQYRDSVDKRQRGSESTKKRACEQIVFRYAAAGKSGKSQFHSQTRNLISSWAQRDVHNDES